VEKLKKAYFTADPQEILDIWLFKDKTSYETHCKGLFGKTPDTPYGYFSAADKALVMNISTGGGTLVHEIVHPFVAANFPDCPAWFNEGLVLSMSKAEKFEVKFTVTRTGACRACRTPFAKGSCLRWKHFAARPKANSMRRTAAPITHKRDIFATICNKKIC